MLIDFRQFLYDSVEKVLFKADFYFLLFYFIYLFFFFFFFMTEMRRQTLMEGRKGHNSVLLF